MGNSVSGDSTQSKNLCEKISKFYTSSAWIDDRAEQQLKQVASWAGVQRVAAFPDLHPGKFGPVGCAVLADRIYPQLIGNDIGCGMSLFQLDLPVRKIKLEKCLRRIRILGEPPTTSYAQQLEAQQLAPDLHVAKLGSIGGGNHFCELQTLASADDDLGLSFNNSYLLVHSGSRSLGNAIFDTLCESDFAGLLFDQEAAVQYIQVHNQAVRWASLNRQIIAERAAVALRCEMSLIVDSPHNALVQLHGGYLHRKGAADATTPTVPLAGTRASASFLMAPKVNAMALQSSAHGAGRRYDRSSMHGRVAGKRSDLEAMQRTVFGGRVVCEDRDLLIEEAPTAYKSSQSVADDLEETEVARVVAEFHPLLTFKKTRREVRA